MKDNLVVNPFLQIQLLNEEEAHFFLVAPKIQSGLQRVQISSSTQSNLYELFLDLAKVRFDLLDIERDINEAERKLLLESGILVESENVPQRPLFACSLDEVDAAEFDGDIFSLIVNPTFRFQPADLGNFSSWIQEKHLLPYQPTIWIKTPLTEIEIGYWLNQEQAEAVSQFKAGEKLPCEIEAELLLKLITAEILTSPERLRQKEEDSRQTLNLARETFRKNKYAVLRGLLPVAQMKAMRNYYREYVRQGFMPFGDVQVDRRYYQYNEPLARYFHSNLAKLMSLVAGEEIKPSYVYAASYKSGATLKPHIDREACEFSFSFQVDYQPEPENHLSPWGLYLSTKNAPNDGTNHFDWKYFPPDADDENTKAVYLASGDSLVYKGCELIHYRYALPEGHQSTSLFFHYVPKDFAGSLI